MGDKVIHNSYGLCKIDGVQAVENAATKKQDCYVIYMGKTKVIIPFIHAGTLRYPVSKEKIPDILARLSNTDEIPTETTKEKVIELYTEKFKTNDPIENAEILRDLTFLKELGQLTVKEKNLLNCVRKILINEISYVQKINRTEAEKIIDQCLCKVIEKAKCQRKKY